MRGIHDLETRQQVLSVFVSPCRKSTIWSSSSAGRSGFDVTVVVQFEAEALKHWPIARFGTRKSPDASPRALRHAPSGSSHGSGSRYFIRAISSPIPQSGLRWNKLANDTILACVDRAFRSPGHFIVPLKPDLRKRPLQKPCHHRCHPHPHSTNSNIPLGVTSESRYSSHH